jgi:hypothetical protein
MGPRADLECKPTVEHVVLAGRRSREFRIRRGAVAHGSTCGGSPNGASGRRRAALRRRAPVVARNLDKAVEPAAAQFDEVPHSLGGLLLEVALNPLVSPWQSAKLQRVAKGDFSPQFARRLALDAARDNRFAALGCLADEWQHAVAAGLGDQDLTVVTQVLETQ